jgi:uncharacterized protein YggT (Ycf19 family)
MFFRNIIKELFLKSVFWILSIFSLLKLINISQWWFIGQYFNNRIWYFFVNYTHYFWIGFGLLTIFVFNGLPNPRRFFNIVKPKE